MKMKVVENISHGLVFVGGLNWGLVGLFGFNLVEAIFGSADFWIKAIYTLVGVATLYSAYLMFGKR